MAPGMLRRDPPSGIRAKPSIRTSRPAPCGRLGPMRRPALTQPGARSAPPRHHCRRRRHCGRRQCCSDCHHRHRHRCWQHLMPRRSTSAHPLRHPPYHRRRTARSRRIHRHPRPHRWSVCRRARTTCRRRPTPVPRANWWRSVRPRLPRPHHRRGDRHGSSPRCCSSEPRWLCRHHRAHWWCTGRARRRYRRWPSRCSRRCSASSQHRSPHRWRRCHRSSHRPYRLRRHHRHRS